MLENSFGTDTLKTIVSKSVSIKKEKKRFKLTSDGNHAVASR